MQLHEDDRRPHQRPAVPSPGPTRRRSTTSRSRTSRSASATGARTSRTRSRPSTRGLIPPRGRDRVAGLVRDALRGPHRRRPCRSSGASQASRAPRYDYTVQWAPGVEPADGALPAARRDRSRTYRARPSTGGATTPLAMIDPAADQHRPRGGSRLAAPRERPHDHPARARHRALRERRRAGEARRPIAIVNTMNGLDPDLLPGFPLQLGGSVEAGPSSRTSTATACATSSLTSSDGSVHVFSVKGGPPTEIPGFPYRCARRRARPDLAASVASRAT